MSSLEKNKFETSLEINNPQNEIDTKLNECLLDIQANLDGTEIVFKYFNGENKENSDLLTGFLDKELGLV